MTSILGGFLALFRINPIEPRLESVAPRTGMGEDDPESPWNRVGAQSLDPADIVDIGNNWGSTLGHLPGDEDGAVERQVFDLTGMLAQIGKHEPPEHDIAFSRSRRG